MILLLGGTSETPQIANLLAESNCKVLISNLTESLVDWDLSSGIRLRHGALDINSMSDLIAKEGITIIVDAAHPYAEQLHTTAMQVSSITNTPYYRYERPSVNYNGYDVELADNHQKAAASAFRIGRSVLLTTGTRNLEPYTEIAQKTDSKLYVRVLPRQESMDICKKHAIDNDHIIAEQGPFAVEQNIEVIKKYSIDVLVTKDSGIAGGVPEKLEAARICGIKVVIIRKPAILHKPAEGFEDISELIKKVTSCGKDTVHRTLKKTNLSLG